MKPVALALVALSLAGSAPAADQARRATLERIEPAWSPDGRRLAYVAPARGGATDLFVVDADGTHRGRLTRTGTADELAPDWSPDGKRLVVERAGEIYVLRADASAERRLIAGWEPAWSPGGRRIAFVLDDRLHVISIKGGSARQLTAAPGRESAPAWSPNGRRIAFVSDASGFLDVYLLELRSGSVRRLTADRQPKPHHPLRRTGRTSSTSATGAAPRRCGASAQRAGLRSGLLPFGPQRTRSCARRGAASSSFPTSSSVRPPTSPCERSCAVAGDTSSSVLTRRRTTSGSAR
jgi:hypothetical protein